MTVVDDRSPFNAALVAGSRLVPLVNVNEARRPARFCDDVADDYGPTEVMVHQAVRELLVWSSMTATLCAGLAPWGTFLDYRCHPRVALQRVALRCDQLDVQAATLTCLVGDLRSAALGRAVDLDRSATS